MYDTSLSLRHYLITMEVVHIYVWLTKDWMSVKVNMKQFLTCMISRCIHEKMSSPCLVFSGRHKRMPPPEFSWWGKQENVLFHIFARAYIKHKNTSILCLRGNKKIPPFDFKSVHKNVPPTPWDFNWRKTKWYTTHWIFTVCTQKMSPQWNFDGGDTKRCPPRGIFTRGTQKDVAPAGFLREGTQKMSPSLVFDEGENVPLVTHWVVYHYAVLDTK